MALVERLALLISADSKGAVRGLSQVGSAARKNLGSAESSAGSFFKRMNIGAGEIGLAAAAAGAATIHLANEAGKLNAAAGAVDAVFQGAADSVHEFAKSADELGISQTRASGLASGLGGQLKSLGFSAGAAAEELEKLVQRAADTAVGIATTDDAIASFAALLRGEGDPIEKFGVSIKQTDVNARVLAKGLDTSTVAAKKNSETIARLELLYEQTVDRAGLYGSEANRVAREQAQLSAEFENFKAEVGQGLVPVLLLGIDAVRELSGAFAALVRPVAAAGREIGRFFDSLPIDDTDDWGDKLNGLAATMVLGTRVMKGFESTTTAVAEALRKIQLETGGAASPVDELIDGLRAARDAQDDFDDAQRDAVRASRDYRDAQREVAEALAMTADEAEAAQRGIQNYANAQAGIVNPVLAFIDAMEQMEDIQNAFDTGGPLAFGSGLDSSLDFLAASSSLEQAAIGLAGAIQTGQTSLDEVLGELGQGVERGFIPEDVAADIENKIRTAVSSANDLEGANVANAAATEVAAEKQRIAVERADALARASDRLRDAEERVRDAQVKVARSAEDMNTEFTELEQFLRDNPGQWDAARVKIDEWERSGGIAAGTAERLRDAMQDVATWAAVMDTINGGDIFTSLFGAEGPAGSLFRNAFGGAFAPESGGAIPTPPSSAPRSPEQLISDSRLTRSEFEERTGISLNNTFNIYGDADAKDVADKVAWTVSTGFGAR